MKKLLYVLVLALALTGCAANEPKEEAAATTTATASNEPSAEPVKQMTEQDRALRINEVSDQFTQAFKIETAMLAEPLTFDLTNDGFDEIILYTKKEYNDGLDHYYIGVYSLQDGSQLFIEQYEASDEVLVTPISNPEYRNCLAVIKIFAGASAISYEAEVLAFENNSLAAFSNVSAEIGEPSIENIITDIDADGVQEFKGFGYDYGPGSDRLSRADGVIEDVVFKWNDTEKSYEQAVIGVDGLTDDQRNSIDDLTQEKAVQIIQAAQKLQFDWTSPIETEEGVKKLMRPFFSNNYIYEFLQGGAFFSPEYNGYLQNYTETGDPNWLVPAMTSDAVLEKSGDGVYASLKQEIERGYEGESFTVQASITLVRTKYGWLIDKTEYSS